MCGQMMFMKVHRTRNDFRGTKTEDHFRNHWHPSFGFEVV